MMRSFYYLLCASILLTISSCKKSAIAYDNGCISQITRNYSVNASDSLAAVKLFQQNNLPATGLTFYRVELNNVITNPKGTYIYQHIFALQHYNGLLAFNSYIGYHFTNGVFNYQDHPVYGSVNLNATPNLTLPQVRKLYLAAAKDASSIISRDFKDSCLVAQFGYFDLNSGTGNTTPNIVKAWYITPQHVQYPLAYIRDDNSALIYYFNGIILN